MNIWNQDIFVKAWDYATLKHDGQTYGGALEGQKIPYLNHIDSVAMEVMWFLQNSPNIYDADLAIQCAILHDTIEDTDTTYLDILNIFGRHIADGVQALTKDTQLPTKKEQMSDSLERILQQPTEIALVKLADRISNLYHPPFYWDNPKKLQYIEESEIIYRKLSHLNNLLGERLRYKIDAYHQFIK